MFCYTLVTNYRCVLRELILWTDISSEHPIFIKTVAELTNKNLPKEIVNHLMKISDEFKNLNKQAKNLLNRISIQPMNQIGAYEVANHLRMLLIEFEKLDKKILDILKQLMEYGKEDKVWQTLLEHIKEEQTYMKRLFQGMYPQIM